MPWASHENMKPPVALLAYVPEDPRLSVFYPFTDFSPEWNAIRYALENKIPVRFIDVPLVHGLAPDLAGDGGTATRTMPQETDEGAIEITDTDSEHIRPDPISYLAEIAGFEDAEEWWEHKFELAHHPGAVFEAIESLMTDLREKLPARKDRTEDIREAFMRKAIRTAQREMYTEIAVICGAWHVPALRHMPKQKDDDALIKGLPKVKVETTWIPWTNSRLSFASGYGAGVNSPGWYTHLWRRPADDGTFWLTHTAHIFRQDQIDVSSAHIIEAVRLANALAGIRGLSRPGLKEFSEATIAVFCMGDPIFMRSVYKELIVGRSIGDVPEGAPQVPLQKDLDQQAKKFRLKISDEEKLLKLDLREDSDLQKSIFLHRLQLLGIDWGDIRQTSGKGTFKEEWGLRWYPELTIKLLEKAAWGNTVAEAAGSWMQDAANKCTRLDEMTTLVAKGLPADLRNAVRLAMQRMDELAAQTSDTTVLIDAFLPLVQVSRYGNVRKTDIDTVTLILTTIFYRITAGLPMSCSGINEEEAQDLADKIRQVNSAVSLLEDDELKAAWTDTVHKIIETDHAAAMVKGCCCKILYDLGSLDNDATAREFSKALSSSYPPEHQAGWLEGFLKDAATLLILDDGIWKMVDGWLLGLEESVFLEVIPLLRRTFAIYTDAEKRKIAARVKLGDTPTLKMAPPPDIDVERAERILPLMKMLMGL